MKTENPNNFIDKIAGKLETKEKKSKFDLTGTTGLTKFYLDAIIFFKEKQIHSQRDNFYFNFFIEEKNLHEHFVKIQKIIFSFLGTELIWRAEKKPLSKLALTGELYESEFALILRTHRSWYHFGTYENTDSF